MNFLEKYGIQIENKELLLTALTHTSYANEHNVESYERLEFLGDAILQACISSYLYINKDLDEGDMSKTRASFVCEEALDRYANDIGYKPYIRCGNGQMNDVNATIVADIFEAILGCVFLDKGYDVASKYALDVIVPHIKKHEVFLSDYKSALQELTQTEKKSLEYVVVSEEGPSHDKTYVVEVRIDHMIYGRGTGKSKKDAEQAAAKDAFLKQARI